MFELSPWLLIGALVGALTLSTGAYFKGRADMYDKKELEIADLRTDAVEKVQKTRDALTAQANAAVGSLETKNVASRVIYRTLTQQVDKIIDRPIYRNGVCLDDDGLRLANAALAGVAVAPAAASQPNVGMPTPLTPQ